MVPKKVCLGTALGLMVLAMLAATFVPEMRVRSARAAAFREGLPTTAAELRALYGPKRGDDGTEMAVLAIANERLAEKREGAENYLVRRDALNRVVSGRGRPEDKARVADWLDRSPTLLQEWRAVAQRSDIAFLMDHRHLVDGSYEGPGLGDVPLGAQRLLAAVALDRDPKANLIAAARLFGATRADVGFWGPYSSRWLTKEMFGQARRLGLVSEVRAALGRPRSVRLALAGSLVAQLEQIESVRHPGRSEATLSWRERLGQIPVVTASAKFRLIDRWRTLWGELPEDDTDFAAALPVLDRHIPETGKVLQGYSSRVNLLWGRYRWAVEEFLQNEQALDQLGGISRDPAARRAPHRVP